MVNKNKYFSLEGLAFQTGGTYEETAMNISIALRIIKQFIVSGGSSSDVRDALDFVESECSKTKPIIKELNIYLFSDDLLDGELNCRMCKRLYNDLVRRVRF